MKQSPIMRVTPIDRILPFTRRLLRVPVGDHPRNDIFRLFI